MPARHELTTPLTTFGVRDIEVGAFPTSYIPTAGATATRAVEVATLPVGTWFNQWDHWHADVQTLQRGHRIRRYDTHYIADLNDGSTNSHYAAKAFVGVVGSVDVT